MKYDLLLKKFDEEDKAMLTDRRPDHPPEAYGYVPVYEDIHDRKEFEECCRMNADDVGPVMRRKSPAAVLGKDFDGFHSYWHVSTRDQTIIFADKRYALSFFKKMEE